MNRRDEERANDITAVECDGCGDEGHTAQSGGDINLFRLEGKEDLYVCDLCLTNYVTPEESEELACAHPLTAEQYAQVRKIVDTERADRDLPPFDKFQPNWAELGPELLAALKVAVESTSWHGITDARAIIARAEGRTP